MDTPLGHSITLAPWPSAATPARAALIFVALSFMLAGCDEKKPERQAVLKEAIHVRGSCSEDHVGRPDTYAGQIVRWQTIETGQVLTYGFVMRSRWLQHAIDEAMHPNSYHPPSTISFAHIEIDTSQPKWVLHGVSEGDEDGSHSYDATCDIEVVERADKVWEMGDLTRWLED
jgi:hypothetical protein